MAVDKAGKQYCISNLVSMVVTILSEDYNTAYIAVVDVLDNGPAQYRPRIPWLCNSDLWYVYSKAPYLNIFTAQTYYIKEELRMETQNVYSNDVYPPMLRNGFVSFVVRR